MGLKTVEVPVQATSAMILNIQVGISIVPGPKNIKTFYHAHLTEHEISTAHKTKMLKKDLYCFQILSCCTNHAYKW